VPERVPGILFSGQLPLSVPLSFKVNINGFGQRGADASKKCNRCAIVGKAAGQWELPGVGAESGGQRSRYSGGVYFWMRKDQPV
jgi:hypothetical protein